MSGVWRNRIVGHGNEAPDQLLANPFNFRKHPKHQRDALRGAMREIGVIQRVIVNRTTGHLIDGHLRVDLALEQREPSVEVLYVELTEAEERVALASLDPIGALAETDVDILAGLLDGITVADDDLAAFLESMRPQDPDAEKPGNTDPDQVPDLQPAAITRPGDTWILGPHRLMCGDSTSIDAVARLADGEIDLIWTDPPYNVAYEGKTKDALTIQNDQMSGTAFLQFLRDLFSAACAVARPGAPIYVAHADSEGQNFRQALTEAGFLYKQCLVWVKNTMVLGRQDYQWQHEPIMYGWKPGAAHSWFGEFNKKTVIDDQPDTRAMDKSELLNEVRRLRNALNASIIREDKPSRSGEHPTMKPVRLILHMLKNSSTTGSRVLDLCGGSGSTMIACEQIGRHARLMEIDPRYCDVIVRRWQEFAGAEARLEATGQTFSEVATIAPAPAENA